MKDVLHAVCTVMMLYPGLAIFLVVVVFNMLGDPSGISWIREMSKEAGRC